MVKKLKEKKGYTLIEIIAAIIILGILILIAVPAINKQLTNFRENYYKKLENSVVSASKDYVTDRRYSKPTKLFYSRVIKVSELEKEGYIDEVKDYLGKKCDNTDTSYSYVVVVKTGEKEYDYTTCLKCSQDEYATDTTGAKNNYCDAAWLTDDYIEYELREDVGEKIYVYYGTNEESIRDELKLTYDVIKKNNDGDVLAKKESDDENDALYPQNIGELVGKNVNTVINLRYLLPSGENLVKQGVIYKHNQPKIEMYYGNDNVYSGKNKNDTYNNGSEEWTNELTVKISYSDNDVKEVIDAIALKDIEYYDEIRKKWIETNCSVSSDKKSCTWTIKNDFNNEIKFRVINDHDRKGDSGDYYSIKVDSHKPECTLNSSGNIGLNDWYISNVTFGFENKTDVLSGIGKYDITDSKTQTFNNLETAVLSTDSVSKTYYGHVVDKAGNTNTCDITVKRDATKPTCTIGSSGTEGDNGWFTSNVSIDLKTEDITSKINSYDLSKSTTATYNKAASSTLSIDTAGTTYYGYVKDNAGNIGKCEATIKRDATKPTCEITPTGTKGENDWYTTNVNLTLGTADTTSQVSTYDLTTVSTASYNNKKSLTLSSDTTGQKYFGYVKDGAGNVNTCDTTIKRDTQKPSTPVIDNPTNGEWSNKSFSLTVTSNDVTAGIDYWYYSYDQTEWTKYDKGDYNSYEKETYVTSPFSKERESLAYIKVCDKAGHCSTSSTWIRIDKTEPTCEVIPSGTLGLNEWYTSDVKLTLDIQDNGSEVSGYGLSESSTATYNSVKELSLKNDITSKTYYGFVTDTAGNNATCQVTVKRDTTIPKCTITPTGNQGTNSWFIGDVAIALTTSDDTSKVNSYDLTTSSTATYKNVKDLSLKTDTTGQKYYAYVKDNAGLTNKCEITVKRDTVKPECSVTPSGTKGDNNWYTTNVGITLTTSDATSDVYAYDLTNSSTATYNKSKTSDNLTTDTTSKTYYGYVKDYAGHVNQCSTTVKRDTENPTCTITPTGTMGNNSWYTSNVAINMTTSDNTSTVKGFDLKTTNSASYTGGNSLSLTSDTASITYYGFVKDDAGHTNTCTKTIKRDATKPTCTITPTGTEGTNDWFKSDVAINLGTSDAMSEVYSYDLTTSTTASYKNTKTLSLTTDTKGQKYYGYVQDKAGNTNTCEKTVKRDTVKPTCTITPTGTVGVNDWFISDVAISLGTSDATSEVLTYDLTRNGVATYNENKTATLTTDTAGIIYYGYVKDNAGWTNTCQKTVKRDVSEPTCEIIASGTEGLSGWYTSNVVLTLVPDDATSYHLSTSSTASYGGTTQLTLQTDSASAKYYGYVKDDAGLTGKCDITVKRDATKPTCTLSTSGTSGNNGWFKSNVTVTFGSKTDATSDVLTYDLTTNKTATFNKVTSLVQEDETNGEIYYGHVKDQAGNIGSCQVTVKKDTVKPICIIRPTGSIGSNEWFVGNVTLAMTPDDLDGSEIVSKGLTETSPTNYNNSTTTSLTTDTSGKTYYGHVQDAAGWTNTCSVTIKRDATKPDAPTITNPTNGNWTNESFKLTVRSSDATSQLGSWSYSYDQTNWQTYANSYNVNPFETTAFTEDMNKLVYIRVHDQAGNYNINSTLIRIDTQGPSCTLTPSGTIGSNNWYTSNVKLTLNVTNNGSEIVKTGITTATSATYDSTISYEKTISTNMDETTYWGYVQDSAGNTTKCSTKIKIDVSKPTCDFSVSGTLGDNGWYKSNVVLTLVPGNDTSGIASKGTNSVNTKIYNGTVSQTVNWETDGVTYYGFVKDNAGNEGTCSKTVKRDTTAPSCTITATGDKSGSIFTGTVTVTMTPSGANQYDVTTSQTTPSTYANNKTTTLTSDGTVRYYGHVKDAAGWTNSCYVDVVRTSYVTLTYDNNSGSGCTSKQAIIGQTWGDLCTPSRTNYNFTGWYSGSTQITSSTKVTGPLTVKASWSAKSYTLTYNNQSGTGCSSKTGTYGGTWGDLCTPSRTGYTFGGWYTSTGGSGTNITANSSVGGDQTVYAKWTPNAYTIVFYGNGYTGGSTANKACTYDTDCALTANGFSKIGYIFAGWATTSSGSVTYYNGQTVKNLVSTNGGVVNLYAKWTAGTYTIAFNANGGTGTTANKSCTYDSNCTLTANGFSRNEYYYKGWNTKADGSGTSYSDGATVKNLASSGTTTLYANWKPMYQWTYFNGTYCWTFAANNMGGGANFSNGKLYLCTTLNDSSTCQVATAARCQQLSDYGLKYFRLTLDP